MYEIAIPSSFARAFVVRLTFGLSKIGDRAILDNNLVHVIIFTIHGIEALFSLFFCRIFNINISHHVLTNVISDHKI